MKYRKLTHLLCYTMCVLLTAPVAWGQGVITIDQHTQRFVGSESSFHRGKYLTFHTWFKKSDPDFEQFKTAYNIDPAYNGSRLFNNPAQRHNAGKYPQIKANHSGVRKVVDLVSTASPKFLFYDKALNYGTADIRSFSKEAAEFAAEYFSKQADFVPKYYEPFNEPMVHARDFVPKELKGAKRHKAIQAIVLKVIEHQRDVARAVHAKPELKNMLVAGYGSAFPEFEAHDFGLWNNRFKRFIDIAGKDIDIFSFHLYDGSGINNKDGRRSGSNSEAIIDLIENYSHIALGTVKPYAITEYGRLVPDQPNYKQNGNYVPLVNAQAVRSQMHMVMNFIERGDKMLLSTPFTIGKAKPKARYSKSSLWVFTDEKKYELSQRRFFFEVWKDVKGERVLFNSSNVDVQTQAFVSGKDLFVVLNNLNDETQTVKLNLLDDKKLKRVEIKRLMVHADKLPALSLEKSKKAPKTLAIKYGETIVLRYQFKKKIKFDNTIYSKKYYSNTYLQPIEANKTLSFDLQQVEQGDGLATLRLGVGRDHGLSLRPTVSLNGKEIELNGDLIRGYDQHNRTRFFGTLEIPVPIQVVQNGTNKLSVTFPDKGGHVTSVILQVQKADKPIDKEIANY